MTGPLLLKEMVVSSAEASFYLVGYLSIFSFWCFTAYQVTRRKEYQEYTSLDFLGIPVDRACDTWWSQLDTMQKTWWFLVLYLVVSKAMRLRMPVLVWSFTCGILSTVFVFYVFELGGLLLISAIVAWHLLVAAIFRSRIAVWIAHVTNLYFLYSDAYDDYCYKASVSEELYHVLFSACPLIAIRCLMFFNDVLRAKEGNAPEGRNPVPLLAKENLCTFLHFVFYPPTLMHGPIFVFKEFKKSLFTPVKAKYLILAFRAVRLFLWAGLMHVSFYIHYRAFLLLPHFMNENDDMAFAGCLYLNGIRFHLIYIQAYGWPNVLGHFDGFNTPEWPRCISHIFSYVEMWKYFDRGLYDFIKSYIYIPLGGNRTQVTKLLSTIGCFTYVYIYHGTNFNVFIWIFMNFLQILVEMAVMKFYYSDAAKLLHSTLSPAWTRRLFALLGAWTFMFSCLAFFYFDVGYSQTTEAMRVCGSARFWVIFFVFSYCLVQISIECRVRGLYQERSSPKQTEVEIEEKKDL